ncbi:hypothetical protein KSY34_18420, partial [Phocaeicola coprocola]|nr:hypothetical protein [Phocaeicola coprocola]HCY70394.1 hypothetical protein [Bacteroides cellulosilyticus]MBV4009928.1 hypothetical protein [Phocaeicola coprocola]MBV4034406.1 hypothetical protein [Phocaeicola coprocola]MBV4040999.1 hypothetical protein [Phocaeicola coprocola]
MTDTMGRMHSDAQ